MCFVLHGKSAPESGFSIKMYILGIHGHSLKEDTIEAFRVIKDAIFRHPSLLDVPVTKEMLRSVKASRQRYQVDLEANRLLLEKEAARKREKERKRKDKEREEESKKELIKELETVKAALSQVENEISIADEMLMKKTGILRNFHQKRMPHEKICKELKVKFKWESNSYLKKQF